MTETTVNERPLVTFALFAYNQEEYIREAVEGAFSQTYEPLEIILSDDCSTDRTFDIIQAMAAAYKGPHRIVLNRSPENRGVAAHVSQVLSIASGGIFIMAAGDDISLNDRCSVSHELLEMHPSAMFAEIREIPFFDGDNLCDILKEANDSKANEIQVSLDDYLNKRAPRFIGALRAVRRDALISYGPFNPACPTEDTPSVLRLLMIGTGIKTERSGVIRRVHDRNLSSVDSLRRMNFDSILQQYIKDIDFAESTGVVSEQGAERLREWARATIQDRKISLAHRGEASSFFGVIRSANVSMIRKIKEVFRYSMRAVGGKGK